MIGILLVDKPAGMTSHDVVNRIRKVSGIRRVGHTGTLDPAATGLLMLCLGVATRLSEFLTKMDKTYEGVLRLGTVTDSYDLDGEILETNEVPSLSPEALQEAFNEFTGDLMQVPPMVSAVKIGGERLYKKARKGEEVERPPRAISVHEFRLVDYVSPDARFVVRCTSGTYARSLCHEVGARLGCGGVLASLRRTQVGRHDIRDAYPLGGFVEASDVESRLMPIEEALDLPEVVLRGSGEAVVAAGGSVERSHVLADFPVCSGWVQMKSESGALLALGEVQHGLRVQPKRVFCGPP